MTATQTGILAGLLLGVATALGGFGGFVIALVLGLLGFFAGRVLDGEMDLSELMGRGRDR